MEISVFESFYFIDFRAFFHPNGMTLLPTIMDKSVDTFEQNKCFLSASLRKFKKHFFYL